VALAVKNGMILADTGHPLSPAIVLEGGQLLRRVDETRPPVDVQALRRAEEEATRAYEEVLENLRRKRRSNQVTSSQSSLLDSSSASGAG
jgi:hypothetical protein